MSKRSKLQAIGKLATVKPTDIKVLKTEHLASYSGLAHLLQNCFDAKLKDNALLLPNLKIFGNKSIGIFSDYAGETTGNYHTYSFLVCAWETVGFFHQVQKTLRAIFSLGNKEISFKEFRNEKIKNALPTYLQNLDDYVVGLLFTVVVDKKIKSFYEHGDELRDKALLKELNKHGSTLRKSKTAEKFIRILEITSFLTGLLANNGQKIFWMTDHDDIVANPKLHNECLDIYTRMLPFYSDHQFELIGGARPFEQKDVEYLDLLSAADISASTLEHYHTKIDTSDPLVDSLKDGADDVINWLVEDGLSLKKGTLLIKLTATNEIKCSYLSQKKIFE